MAIMTTIKNVILMSEKWQIICRMSVSIHNRREIDNEEFLFLVFCFAFSNIKRKCHVIWFRELWNSRGACACVTTLFQLFQEKLIFFSLFFNNLKLSCHSSRSWTRILQAEHKMPVIVDFIRIIMFLLVVVLDFDSFSILFFFCIIRNHFIIS